MKRRSDKPRSDIVPLLSPPPPLKDTLRQKAERIEELEEALRESVQITAEREMVLAQEEAARSLQEKQVWDWSPRTHSCITPTAHTFTPISYTPLSNTRCGVVLGNPGS